MKHWVITILSGASKKDRIQYEKQIALHKRDKLKKLFNYLNTHLRKVGSDGFKNKLFKHVFNEDFQPKKDFLLRNELRLLGKEIKNIIVAIKVKQHDSYGLVFLHYLNDNGFVDLFRQEYEKLFKAYELSKNYQQLSVLASSFIDKKARSSDYTIQTKEKLKANIVELIQIENISHLEQVRQYEAIIGYAEGVIGQLKGRVDNRPLSKKLDYLDDDNNSNLSWLKYWTAQSYHHKGEDAIKDLEKVLKYTHLALEDGHDLHKELSATYAKIGLQYMLFGNYDKAVQFFESSLAIPNLNQGLLIPICLNYISSLSKKNQFEKALKVFEKHPSLLDKIHVNERLQYLYFMLLVLCNQTDFAYHQFPLNIKEGDLDIQQSLRIVLSIIYVDQGMADLALNELNNLSRHIKKSQHGLVNADVDIMNFIRSYLNIIQQTGSAQKSQRKKLLQELKSDFDIFKAQQEKFQSDTLIVKWMEQKLDITQS